VDTSEFEFSLPPELVATVPALRREQARLLVMDRTDGSCKHARFHELLGFLPARSLLVLNDTRVFPARLRGRKPTGGAVEFLLTRRGGELPREGDHFVEEWEALARGMGGVSASIDVGGGVVVTIRERREAGAVLVRVTGPGPSLLAALDAIGEVPLPPYIEAARRRDPAAADAAVDDRARYQTVYAATTGAVAAPTAGLHFTPELLAAMRDRCAVVEVDLRIGLDTFRPVAEDDLDAHAMHSEAYAIDADVRALVTGARAAGRRVVAVGTTAARVLETIADPHAPDAGRTRLKIQPPYAFRVVDALVTNFHLPRSTLLALVMAFCGAEETRRLYRLAIEQRYRFYSFGDAMLIR